MGLGHQTRSNSRAAGVVSQIARSCLPNSITPPFKTDTHTPPAIRDIRHHHAPAPGNRRQCHRLRSRDIRWSLLCPSRVLYFRPVSTGQASQPHLFHYARLQYETRFKRWCNNTVKAGIGTLSRYFRWFRYSQPHKTKGGGGLQRFTYSTSTETVYILRVDFV